MLRPHMMAAASHLDGIGQPGEREAGNPAQQPPAPSGRRLPLWATKGACGAGRFARAAAGDWQPPTESEVICHDIGHELDDARGPGKRRQSGTPEFRVLYAQCEPHLAGRFYRNAGDLGRREFFADVFAALATLQRPAVVDILGGHTRIALAVMLFFNQWYGL